MLKLLATGLAASFLLLPPAQAAPPAPYGVQPHQQAVQRAGEQRQRQLQNSASASTNNACNCSRINCNASSRTCSGNGSSDRCRTT